MDPEKSSSEPLQMPLSARRRCLLTDDNYLQQYVGRITHGHVYERIYGVMRTVLSLVASKVMRVQAWWRETRINP